MHSHGSPVSARLWFGVAILVLGILWTLDNLNIMESEPILSWWPLLLIAFGVTRLLRKDRPPMLVAGALWIFFGILLLGRTQHLYRWDPGDLWPIFLIAVGATIVWRATHGPTSPRARRSSGGAGEGGEPVADPSPPEIDVISAVAVWAGVDRKSNSPAFRGGDFTAWMGGGEIDLRGAEAAPGGAVLDVFVLMGGLEIRVPEDWQVANEMFVFMGGIEDSRKSIPSTSRSTLYLKGTCMMGGVEIKN